jgi:alkylated DNA repair protein (DNA oxidative demethylase)
MQRSLFEAAPPDTRHELLEPGAWLLHGFALAHAAEICAAAHQVSGAAPFRHMETPGGLRMSVAMTNCGRFGWVSDRRGYRYAECDPHTGIAWPAMPAAFLELAQSAAAAAGFADFVPDACLVNRYEVGTRLSLHQDKDERQFGSPIVSVSLGLPAVFLWGGDARADKARRLPLVHGDVVVWGGPARLRFHGVLPLKDGRHETVGAQRLNLTFRRAG